MRLMKQVLWHNHVKVTRQTKTAPSSPRCLWPPVLAVCNLHWWTLAQKVTWPFDYASSDIAWQSKTIISPLQQCLWQPNFVGWWLILRGSYLCYSTLWSHGLARSRDKMKPFYLYYHNVYGHQTRQGCDLPWRTPTHKGTSSFDHVVLQDLVIN